MIVGEKHRCSHRDQRREWSYGANRLTKGPNYFSPARHPERAQGRLAYVQSRMQEDGSLTGRNVEGQVSSEALPPLPPMVPYERSRRDIGYHFADQVAREVKTVGIRDIATGSYTVRSTIDQPLQRAVEESLQEGLSRYERSVGRVQFRGAEANLAEAIQRIEADSKRTDTRPSWQQALANARLPLYDVHWASAVVVEKLGGRNGEAWGVGLIDGRVLPLTLDHATARKLTMATQIEQIETAVASLEKQLMAWHRSNPVSQRLATIPGIGPIITTAIAATVVDPVAFRSGREFAA